MKLLNLIFLVVPILGFSNEIEFDELFDEHLEVLAPLVSYGFEEKLWDELEVEERATAVESSSERSYLPTFEKVPKQRGPTLMVQPKTR